MWGVGEIHVSVWVRIGTYSCICECMERQLREGELKEGREGGRVEGGREGGKGGKGGKGVLGERRSGGGG